VADALAAIGDAARKSEEDLWREFEADRPQILGALLDAVAHGIKTLPGIKLERLPRMADFAKWSNACEEALFKKGTFAKAYSDNITETITKVVENDLVATAVMRFFEQIRDKAILARPKWEGSSSELLDQLCAVTPDQTTRGREWPQNARALSSKLRRIAQPLRHLGIDVDFGRTDEGRFIAVTEFTGVPAKIEEGTAREGRPSPNF
jgi:hypothetical protein